MKDSYSGVLLTLPTLTERPEDYALARSRLRRGLTALDQRLVLSENSWSVRGVLEQCSMKRTITGQATERDDRFSLLAAMQVSSLMWGGGMRSGTGHLPKPGSQPENAGD